MSVPDMAQVELHPQDPDETPPWLAPYAISDSHCTAHGLRLAAYAQAKAAPHTAATVCCYCIPARSSSSLASLSP
eukprot:480523-Rhodomonas_salina.4